MYVVKKEDVLELREELAIVHDVAFGGVDVGGDNVLVLMFEEKKVRLPVEHRNVSVASWRTVNDELLRLEEEHGYYSLFLADRLVCTTPNPKTIYDLIYHIQNTVPVLVYGSFLDRCSFDIDRETRQEIERPLSVRRLYGCKAVFWRMNNEGKFAYIWPTRIKPTRLDFYPKAFTSTLLCIGGREVVAGALTGLNEYPVSIEGKPVSFGSLLDIFHGLGVEPIPVFPQ